MTKEEQLTRLSEVENLVSRLNKALAEFWKEGFRVNVSKGIPEDLHVRIWREETLLDIPADLRD